MNTWMIVCSVWAMCALAVVLFIRGAHPHVEGADASAEGVDVRVRGMKGESRPH
jgi:hypothetical protein